VWREIETWRRMQHPNIVQLFEILTTETKIYMVMEYVEGGELFDYVTQCGALDEVSARRLFKQLVGAIKYCHDSNFVHR
jgi:serine/threonine protein kinase